MKVNQIEPGRIFIFGPTLSRPQLKLKEGFLDIVSNYVYVCWGDKPATILTETQILKLKTMWRMTEEGFNEFKKALIKAHSNKE